MGFFLKHAPKIIENGNLYKLIPPLYGVGPKNSIMLYSDQELLEYEAKHGTQKDIKRYKGLGALSESLTEDYIMGDKRKLVQIKMDDIEEMKELFDTFLGKDIEGRRKLVSEGYNEE